MKNSTKKELVLPQLQTKRVNIKSFLQTVKEKKMELQDNVLKSQESEEETPLKQSPYNLLARQRVITQIPCYENLKREKRKNRIQDHFLSTIHRRTKTEHSASNNLSEEKERTHDKTMLPTDGILVQIEEKSQESIKIQQLFYKIPRQPRKRTEENTAEIRKYLVENNIFFMKISSIAISCVLKLSKFICVEKNKFLCKIGQVPTAFYIIIDGKVKLLDSEKGFKKICVGGECFLEESLFTQPVQRRAFETSKTCTRTYLVEIRLQSYRALCQQMLKFGYKTQFLEMESLIKRNYISKNWLRKNNKYRSGKTKK